MTFHPEPGKELNNMLLLRIHDCLRDIHKEQMITSRYMQEGMDILQARIAVMSDHIDNIRFSKHLDEWFIDTSERKTPLQRKRKAK